MKLKPHVRIHGAKSVFEKYCGIGNPGIPRGRKAVVRWLRELRDPWPHARDKRSSPANNPS